MGTRWKMELSCESILELSSVPERIAWLRFVSQSSLSCSTAEILLSFNSIFNGSLQVTASALMFSSHRRHGLDKTVLSCLVRVGGVNRIGDKSRLSATENSETVFFSVSKCGEDYWKQSWLVAKSVHTINKKRSSFLNNNFRLFHWGHTAQSDTTN